MKKTVRTNIIKTIAFLLLAAVIFSCLNSILVFKYSDGFKQMDAFYRQDDDTVDVLILGSSHAFESFIPSVFWDNYGYSSFIMSASVQPLWNSYFYMEEALKTQTPKVIILEGYRLVSQAADYADRTAEIKSTYPLKWSKTKLDAMRASFSMDTLLDNLLEFPSYHSRYNELSKVDFAKYYNNQFYEYYKGEVINTNHHELKMPDVASFDKSPLKLKEKTEEYYRKILQLAQEKNIPVITVIAPYTVSKTEYRYYKYAENIAKEYNMPFINANELYDDLGIDFAKDFGDKDGHLNANGAKKFSKYMAEYLSENYTIEDHRGDDAYRTWDFNSVQFKRYYYHDDFKKITDLSEYLEKYNQLDNYSLILTVNAGDTLSKDVQTALQSLFSTEDASAFDDRDGVYVFRNQELSFVSHDTKLDQNIHFDSQTDIRVCCKTIDYTIDTFSEQPTFCVYINNNDTLQAMPLGATLILYDEYLNRVVETVYYPSDADKLTRTNDYLESKE